MAACRSQLLTRVAKRGTGSVEPRPQQERPAVERITAEQRGHRGNELHPVEAVAEHGLDFVLADGIDARPEIPAPIVAAPGQLSNGSRTCP
jgi:hypothetical protein